MGGAISCLGSGRGKQGSVYVENTSERSCLQALPLDCFLHIIEFSTFWDLRRIVSVNRKWRALEGTIVQHMGRVIQGSSPFRERRKIEVLIANTRSIEDLEVWVVRCLYAFLSSASVPFPFRGEYAQRDWRMAQDLQRVVSAGRQETGPFCYLGREHVERAGAEGRCPFIVKMCSISRASMTCRRGGVVNFVNYLMASGEDAQALQCLRTHSVVEGRKKSTLYAGLFVSALHGGKELDALNVLRRVLRESEVAPYFSEEVNHSLCRLLPGILGGRWLCSLFVNEEQASARSQAVLSCFRTLFRLDDCQVMRKLCGMTDGRARNLKFSREQYFSLIDRIRVDILNWNSTASLALLWIRKIIAPLQALCQERGLFEGDRDDVERLLDLVVRVAGLTVSKNAALDIIERTRDFLDPFVCEGLRGKLEQALNGGWVSPLDTAF